MALSTATNILRKEHEDILDMLDAAEEIAWRLDRGERVPPETVDCLLEFFRLFADRCHHGKEEELLFPLLEEKGMRLESGPIGVMLFEHDEGRALIRQMEESAQAYARGTVGSGARWATAAHGYVALFNAHISKENNVLFPLADRLLGDVEQKLLAHAFEKVEQEKMGAGTHEHMHTRMKQLLEEIFHGQA